ncbi:MAG: transporter substrate-binding domain-containing protein [Methylotenera sp.]|jgi:polar amino acid transport system substrate-binding protein|nr:transporter substrate-binding domain-containing protein [Methylotenera sp.]
MPTSSDPARQRPSRRWWLGLTLGLLCSPVLAQARCGRPLVVAVSELGLGAYQEQGELRGIVPDLIRELQARSGCALSLVMMPRARALLAFDRGEVDVITSVMRTHERDRVGAFLPYGYTKHDLLVLPEYAAGIGSLADVVRRPEMTVGVVRGIRTNSRVDAQIEQLLMIRRAEYSADYTGLSAKLSARRIQAAIVPNALHVKLRRDGLVPADLALIDVPEARPQALGLYLNRQRVTAPMIVQLERPLAAMVSSGWVRQTYVRHLGEAETRRMYRALEQR